MNKKTDPNKVHSERDKKFGLPQYRIAGTAVSNPQETSALGNYNKRKEELLQNSEDGQEH